MLETVVPLKLLVEDESFFEEYLTNDKARLYNVLLDECNKDVFGSYDLDKLNREKLEFELRPKFKDGKIRTILLKSLLRELK